MLVQGATAYISFNMSDKLGRINLNGATVEFIFRRNEAEAPIKKLCEITDVTNGIVSILLTPEDLQTSGNYYYQVKVTFSDNTVIKSEVVAFYVEESLM